MREWLERYQDMRTVRQDHVSWQYMNEFETVALGDLHGDLDALLQILSELNLIDSNTGRWLGKSINLVLLGDFINGAGQTRILLDYLIRLKQEMNNSSGRLHLLAGNHEIELSKGDEDKMPSEDQEDFLEFSIDGRFYESVESIFRQDNKYTRLFSGLQMMVQINRVLYVHAGVQGWLMVNGNTPSSINSTWRAWQRYWSQGENEDLDFPRPDRSTRWIVHDDHGPGHLQDFRFHQRGKHALTESELMVLLRTLGSEAIVKGHNVTPNHRIQLEHPEFGERVISIDTGISRAKDGRVSALISKTGLSGRPTFQALYFERPPQSKFKPVRRILRDMLKNKCEALFY